MTESLWRECYLTLHQEIEKQGLKDALNPRSFDDFQATIEYFCTKYKRRSVTVLIREKLFPHFLHIKSFEKAISLSAQAHQSTIFIWVGLQAVIECAYRFAEHLEETLDQFVDFCKTLPKFEQYMDLFPNNKRIEYALRDLYVDYGRLCILTIRYMKKSPISNIAGNILSSKKRLELKALRSSMVEHKKDFNEATEFAYRQHQINASQGSVECSSLPVSPASKQIVPVDVRPWCRSPGSQATVSCHAQHSVLLRKNPMFLGRDLDLELLHGNLNSPDSFSLDGPVSCLVHGIRGIGKTQLTLEFAYRFRFYYDLIIWLPSVNLSELEREYKPIATKFCPHDVTPASSLSDLLEVARTWLETTGEPPGSFVAFGLGLTNPDKRWLIVFDNVENWNEISSLWPSLCQSKSAIIVTSEKPELKTWITTDIALRCLDESAGCELLLKSLRLGHPASVEEEQAAGEIAHMVGCLPLAVSHIGGYVSEAKCTLSEFKAMISGRHPDFWQCEKPSTLYQYNKSLDSVWDDALNKLPDDARGMIHIMAFLNPDLVPEGMIFSHFRPDLRGEARKARFTEMTRQLLKRSLVDRRSDGENSYFTIQRTLQLAILYKLDKNLSLRHQTFSQALERVRRITPSASPIQAPNPSQWRKFDVAISQVSALRAVFLQSAPPIVGTHELAQLLYDAGFHTWERELSYQGLDLLGTAESILDDLGADLNSKLRADIHAIAGVICDNIGATKKGQGLQHRRKALKIRELIFDDSATGLDRRDETLLYNARNDLAEALLQEYEYREAKSLIDMCKKKYEEWGTEDNYPFEYGKYYRNNGAVMALQGRFEEAIKSGSRAIELAELDLPESQTISPRYLFYAYDVACHMLQCGDIGDALDMHMFILESRKTVCGDLHDVTLQSLYTIGAIYSQMDELAEAERWMREALGRAKQARWPEEPLSRAQYHLMRVLRAQGKDTAEAVELERQALLVLDKQRSDMPYFLQDVKDQMILFDHLQPLFRGRFTGTGLLDIIRQKNLL